jgi:hypothetical protein
MDCFLKAFRNTLWFLVPSGLLSFTGIFATYLMGKYSDGFSISLESFIGYGGGKDLSDVYYLLLLPNIPFFIASFYLFYAIGEKVVLNSILPKSISIGAFSWMMTIVISPLFIKPNSDIGLGIIYIIGMAIIALIIFLFRAHYLLDLKKS